MQVSAHVILLLDAASEHAWHVAQQLAAAGATLVLHDEADSRTLKEYARNLHSQGHSPLPIVAELTDAQQRKALFERIHKIHGRLDLFMQMPLASTPFLNMSPDAFKQELSSLTARLHSLREGASELAKAGGGELLLLAEPNEDTYVHSAYRRYGESIAAELSEHNISFRPLSLAQLSLELSPQIKLEFAAAPQPQSRARRWFTKRRKPTTPKLAQIKEPS